MSKQWKVSDEEVFVYLRVSAVSDPDIKTRDLGPPLTSCLQFWPLDLLRFADLQGQDEAVNGGATCLAAGTHLVFVILVEQRPQINLNDFERETREGCILQKSDEGEG